MTRHHLTLGVLCLAALAPFAGCGTTDPREEATDAGSPEAESTTPTVPGDGGDHAASDDGDDGSPTALTDAASASLTDSGPTDGGATSPPQLTGAVLWLEATSGVTLSGTSVSAWQDQSQAHNDAAQSRSQLQPTMITRSGLPALHFSGKSPATPANSGGTGGPYLQIKDAPSLNWGTDDFLLAVVAAYRNPIDDSHLGVIGAFFGKWGMDAGQGQIMFAGNWPHAEHPNVEYSDLYFGFGEGVRSIVTSQTGFNDDQVRLYVAQRTSTGTVVRVSGKVMQTLPSDTVTNVSSVGADVGIGNFGGDVSARALDGDVFAVVAVHGMTSADDLAKLESYLMTSYPVTPPPAGDGG